MNTGTGLSGSTDWNNAVRSRLYLQPKPNDSETPNKNLRTFQGMKSNYGERGGKLEPRMENRCFCPARRANGIR